MKYKVAYTINHTQPVICTLIGDEPLYYTDHYEDEPLQEFFSEREEPLFITEFQESPFKLNALRAHLRMSRTMAETLKGITILQDYSVETVEFDGRIIRLNPRLIFEDAFLLSCIFARWVSKNYPDAMKYTPEDAVLYHRLQHADSHSFMCLIAWEMNLLGWSAPFDRLLETEYQDLIGCMASSAQTDFRSLRNGEAMRNTLEQWFFSDRCNKADEILIRRMLACERYVRWREGVDLDAKAVLEIGWMPDSSVASTMTTRNYLSSVLHPLLSDCIFREPRTRELANFLWYIKFERSFKETEDELRQV